MSSSRPLPIDDLLEAAARVRRTSLELRTAAVVERAALDQLRRVAAGCEAPVRSGDPDVTPPRTISR